MNQPPWFPADAQSPYYSSKKEIQLQGPRPSPLKISNESHKIKKPPPPPLQRHHTPPEPNQQQRRPISIYTVLPPKVITVKSHDEFKDIVQRLTGLLRGDGTPSRADDVSPAARLASIEKTSPTEKEKAIQSKKDDITKGMLERGVEVGQFPGVLTPEPSTLPPIYPEMHSPPVSYPETVSHYYNEFWSANNFMADPLGFPSFPVASPQPSLYREPCMNSFSDFQEWQMEMDAGSQNAVVQVKHEYDGQSVKIMLEHEKHHCFVSCTELNDIAFGVKKLELCHLGIWCTYLYRLCAERGIDNFYGFVCPYKLSLKDYSPNTISVHIKEKLAGNKEVYLAPFCYSDHWQLIAIVPKKSTVVWMCSLGGKPTKQIKDMINIAMKGSFTLDTKWLYPTMAIQENNYHCGYFVMKFMLTIVALDIIDNWEKVFYDPKPYTFKEILDVCNLWLEFYSKILAEQISS